MKKKIVVECRPCKKKPPSSTYYYLVKKVFSPLNANNFLRSEILEITYNSATCTLEEVLVDWFAGF